MHLRITLPLLDRLKIAALKRSWRLSGLVNTTVRATLDGERFLVPIDHRAGFWLLDEGYIQKRFTDIATVLPVALDARPGTVVDIGTNIGLFLYLLAAVDRSRRYVGFETNVLAAAYLQRFIDLNGLRDHTIIPVGLSDATGVLPLRLSYDVDVSATVIDGIRASGQYSDARQVLLLQADDVLPRLLPADEPVSIIKIDVEGAEMEVLDGLRATVERHRPTVIFESLPCSAEAMRLYAVANPAMSPDEVESTRAERARRARAIDAFFEQLDYRLFKMRQSGELSPRKSVLDDPLENRLEQNFLAVAAENAEAFRALIADRDQLAPDPAPTVDTRPATA